METERIRSFIATDLPDASKRALRALQNRLKKGYDNAPVKWVDPNSIHLTLKFLGGIDVAMTARLLAVISEAVRGVRPFQVELKGLGVFPNPNRVRVVWVGMGGDVDKLAFIQERIETGVVPLGFPAENRPFSPHFTLGRVREQASPEERRRLGQLVAEAVFEGGGCFTIDAVHLIKSQLTHQGAIYTKIGSVELSS
jgi:2'-5' RNA ligase